MIQKPPSGGFFRALRAGLLSLILAAGVAGCEGLPVALGAEPVPPSTPQARQPVRVLVDSIHAHNYLKPLAPSASYGYHEYGSYEKAFAYLRSRGVEVSEAKTGRIDAAALKGQSMLFINLVSAELPPFRRGEVDAIRAFVEGGGGLLLITDHTNCYYHTHKLIPLLDELGIEAPMEAACDRNENTLNTGAAWVIISRFKEHPITGGLRRIVYQCGGTVDDRYAVAQLSPAGWGDLWKWNPYGEGDTPGNYGDFVQQPEERAGQLGVLLAREVGKGRVVIVADHNVFANFFINYQDNYRLWLNAVSWCSGEASLREVEPYHRWRGPRILAYENPARPSFGIKGPGGLYNAFDYLTRSMPIFATEELGGEAGAIVFSHGNRPLPEAPLKALAEHLRKGRPAFILNPDPVGKGILQQVSAILGAPETGADADTLWHQWAGGGRLVQIIDRKGINNDTISSFKTPADLDQRRRMALLTRLLTVLP